MDIFDFLRRTIHDLVGTPVEKIEPESSMKELNLDLFDVEELLLNVEKEFDVYIPEETQFKTVGELEEIIHAA